MAMTCAEIEQLIQTAMPSAKVTVEPLVDDGEHFRARVVCADFAGKPLLAQHRAVYAALEGHVGDALHALQLSTSATD